MMPYVNVESLEEARNNGQKATELHPQRMSLRNPRGFRDSARSFRHARRNDVLLLGIIAIVRRLNFPE